MIKFHTLRLPSNIKRLITVERGRFQGEYEFKWRGKRKEKLSSTFLRTILSNYVECVLVFYNVFFFTITFDCSPHYCFPTNRTWFVLFFSASRMYNGVNHEGVRTKNGIWLFVRNNNNDKTETAGSVVTTAEDSEINADQQFHSDFMSHKTCVITFRWFDYINFGFVL